MQRKLSILLILVLIVCSISIHSFATTTDDLQVQYSDIKVQMDQSSEQLNSVQNELSDNLQQIQTIDSTIESTQNQITDLSSKVDGLKTSIETTQLKLTELQEKYSKEQNDLNQRLDTIYESGNTYYLDVLLKASSLSEFLSNYFLISEVTQYDIQLIQDVANEKKEMEETQTNLQNSKNDYVQDEQNQLKAQKVLQNTKIIRQNKVAELSDSELQIQNQIDQYKIQMSDIESQIQGLANNSVGTNYIGGVMAWPAPRIYYNNLSFWNESSSSNWCIQITYRS